MDISKAQSELRRVLYEDHGEFSSRCLEIRNKGGQSVPAHLSPMGVRLWEKIAWCRAQGRPAWIICLKARQSWTSTAVASIFFREIAFTPGQRGDIVADRKENTANIYEYYQQFVKSYDRNMLSVPGYQIEQPKRVKDNALEIVWENDSRIKCQTAGSEESGRSFSSRYLHLSEFAFYPNAATLMTGLMQVLPDDPGTIAIIESTANGEGGEFHDMWQRSIDPASGSDWLSIFLGWHEHHEYVRALTVAPDVFEASITRDEQELRQRFRLSPEQLHWRRWTIVNKCKGDVRRFQQEYPAYPEEAFLTSGRTVFDMKSIARQPREAPPMVGRLEEVNVGARLQVQFVPDDNGWLSVWKRPAQGRWYIAGVDTAEGKEADDAATTSEDPDYSVGNFIDQHTGEQVAKIRDRFVPSYFASILFVVARWYNWAFVVPETKNTGLAMIGELIRLGYPLDLIFRRVSNPNVTRPPTIHELGWVTSMATKPVLVNALDICLREMSLLIHDPISLQELRTFVVKNDGKTEARSGCHDDEVISLALCAMGLRFAPQRREQAITGGSHDLKTPVPQVTMYGQPKADGRGVRVRL